jgi:hypothetical protein
LLQAVDLRLDAWEEVLLLQQAEGHWDWAAKSSDAANETFEGEALLQVVNFLRLYAWEEVLLLQQAEGHWDWAANEFYVVYCRVSLS